MNNLQITTFKCRDESLSMGNEKRIKRFLENPPFINKFLNSMSNDREMEMEIRSNR